MQDDSFNGPNKNVRLATTQATGSYSFLKPGDLLAERFEITQLKGFGRYGSVYQAYDRLLNTKVGIKRLHPELTRSTAAIDQFKNEIIWVRQLNHPNIVRVHEYYVSDSDHFITMDWIDGVTLTEFLEHKTLSQNDINKLFSQLLLALSHVESKGLLHRDLKPDNLLISDTGHLSVTDFGIASLAFHKAQDEQFASPLYAPPEYLLHGKVHRSYDRYSAGVILFELYFQRSPFSANTLEQLGNEKSNLPLHLGDKLVTCSEQQQRALPIINNLLSPIPEQRFSDTESLQQAFRDGLLHPDKNFKNPAAAIKPKHDMRWLTLVVFVLVLLGLTGYQAIKQSSQFTTKEELTVSQKSLAILPLTPVNNMPEWLSSDFQYLLHWHLQVTPELRLIDHHRVNKTMQLLAIEPPVNETQLLMLTDLLNVDHIISGQVLLHQNKPHITLEKITRIGKKVQRKQLLNTVVTEQKIDHLMNQVASSLTDSFNRIALDYKAVSVDATSTQQLLLAQQKILSGQLEAAKQRLQTIADENNSSINPAADTPSLLASHWYQLAHAYIQQNNPAAAIQALQKVITYSPPQYWLRSLAEANLNRLEQRYERAEKIYLSLSQKLPLNTQVLYELASLYIEIEQLDQATSVLKKITTIDANLPQVWFELAKIAIWSGNTQRALDDYLTRALIIAKRLNDRKLESDLHNAFGVAYQRLGQLDHAFESYQQGFQIRQSLNAYLDMATSLANMASIHSIRGEHLKAETKLLKSLQLHSQMGHDEGRANTLNELGIAAEEQGQYQAALQYYRESLTIRMTLDNQWLVAESLNNVGYIYFLMSDVEHSEVYWKQARQAYQEVEDPVGVIRVDENLGQLELSRGNWTKAYQLFHTSFEQSQSFNLVEEQLVAQAYLSRLSFLQGNVSDSIHSLQSVIDEMYARDDVRGILEFSLWLIDWELQLGQVDNATSRLKKITPLMTDKGSQDQQYWFQLLLDASRINESSIDTEDTSSVALNTETNIPELVQSKRLILLAQRALHQNPEQFATLLEQFNQGRNKMHFYDKLRFFELQAIHHLRHKQWQQLKTLLTKLKKHEATINTYWRNFQFQRVAALYSASRQTNAEQLKQQANQQLEHLTQQLRETSVPTFLAQQNFWLTDKQLAELKK